MKYPSVILNKVLVREFYRTNASFFLLVIGLAGGFMRAPDHIALAEFFISSPVLLLIPVLLWMLYAFKVINFITEALNRHENEFLFHFILFSKKEQGLALLSAVITLLIPAVLYGAFLIAIALQHQLFPSVGLIISALLMVVLAVTFKIYSALHHPEQEAKISFLKKFIDRRFNRPYPIFCIEWISRRQPLMLIGSKLFSGLILFGILKLYETDQYDLRLLGIGMAIAFAATSTLVMQIHQFDNLHFSITRQLPLPFYKRISYFLVTIFFLILPETGVLIKNFPSGFNLPDLAVCYLFAISITILFYGYLYLKDRNQEQFTTIVFFIVISWIILILFNIPLLILGVINLAAGIILWRRYYYSFEYISNE